MSWINFHLGSVFGTQLNAREDNDYPKNGELEDTGGEDANRRCPS